MEAIAIGCTLAAKCVMPGLRGYCETNFRPFQVGVGMPKGAEAAVHATRNFLEDASKKNEQKVMLKIDFRNAFNTI